MATVSGFDGMRNQSSSKGSTVKILKPADVLETLASLPCPVSAVMLDPWYNKGVGGERADYDQWLERVITAASKITSHIFVWGFPEIVARQITRLPKHFTLLAWLTWYYKNCPSVIRGWRSAQNTCLHIASDNATIYPQHFLTKEQLERWKAGKMRFIPGPPTVLEAPLNIGFVGKNEQTGHPAQKPVAVIEALLKMATKEGDVVVDPMCGAGTTGEGLIYNPRHAYNLSLTCFPIFGSLLDNINDQRRSVFHVTESPWQKLPNWHQPCRTD